MTFLDHASSRLGEQGFEEADRVRMPDLPAFASVKVADRGLRAVVCGVLDAVRRTDGGEGLEERRPERLAADHDESGAPSLLRDVPVAHGVIVDPLLILGGHDAGHHDRNIVISL